MRVRLLVCLCLACALGSCSRTPQSGVDRSASIIRLADRVKSDPSDARARQSLVTLLVQEAESRQHAGQSSGAEETCSRAVEVDPKNAFAHFSLGRIRLAQGKVKEGLAELEAAARLNPELSAELYYQLGQAYVLEGRLDQARESYLKSLALRPVRVDTYRALAEVHRLEGNVDEARRRETEASALTRYGFPDRGYLTKLLDEWQAEAATSGMHAEEGMQGADGMEEGVTGLTSHAAEPPPPEARAGHGPGRQKQAIALYNVATYRDRAMTSADLSTYEAAVKAWQRYIQFVKGMREESAFITAAMDRMSVVKKLKKVLMQQMGVMPLEEVLGPSLELNQALRGLPVALNKVLAAAQAAGDQTAVKKTQELLAILDQANLFAAHNRLHLINSQAKELMARVQAKDPELTEKKIAAEARRLSADFEQVRAELKAKGLEQVDVETWVLALKYNVKIPKDGAEEEPK